MGKVSYSIYEVLDLQSDKNKKTYQARINSAGTVDTENLCNMISSRSTVSSADVKATLDSLNFYFDHYLSLGYSIQLDELGIFSLGLKSERNKDSEKEDALSVKVNSIHFRPCVELKEKIKGFQLSYKARKKGDQYTKEERLKRILAYVEKNRFIERSSCEELNKVSPYTANTDLSLLIKLKELEPVGSTRNRVYIKKRKD